MEKTLNNKKGITLIALVVTIVILLILAGITINAVMGEGGLIDRAKTAQQKTEEGAENDINAINNLANQAEGIINGIGNGNTPQEPTPRTLEQAKNSTMLNETNNSKITIGSYEVTIPAGYVLAPDSGNTVEQGIVITDSLDTTGETPVSNGNEWVWVPVSNSELATMYVDSSDSPKQLCGTSEPDAKTKYYTTTITYETRNTPGATSGFREPDLIVDTVYASDATDYCRINAGFYTVSGTNETAKSLDEMAAEMIADYENMINSIRTNKGFYIGRYELGQESSTNKKAVVKRHKYVKTMNNWYKLYSACKSLRKEETDVTTRMIYGLQWDATCKWLESNDFNIKYSSTWGNYNDYNTANNYTSGQEGYIAVAGEQQQTGYSNYWSACNIYDFAGNCSEWTQEACSTNSRSYQGGEARISGNGSNSASRRTGTLATTWQSEYLRHSPHFNN